MIGDELRESIGTDKRGGNKDEDKGRESTENRLIINGYVVTKSSSLAKNLTQCLEVYNKGIGYAESLRYLLRFLEQSRSNRVTEVRRIIKKVKNKSK